MEVQAKALGNHLNRMAQNYVNNDPNPHHKQIPKNPSKGALKPTPSLKEKKQQARK